MDPAASEMRLRSSDSDDITHRATERAKFQALARYSTVVRAVVLRTRIEHATPAGDDRENSVRWLTELHRDVADGLRVAADQNPFLKRLGRLRVEYFGVPSTKADFYILPNRE